MLATHEYANDLILFALIVDCARSARRGERRHHQLGGQ